MANQQNKQTKWILWGALIVLVGALICLGIAGASWLSASLSATSEQTSSQSASQSAEDFTQFGDKYANSSSDAAKSSDSSSESENSRNTATIPSTNASTVPEDSQNSGMLRAHFIDVGQGDSEFVELPDGKTLLIDAGEADFASRVIDYISRLGYTRIDYVVVTHPHADHMGGMAEVLDAFDIGEIWMPDAVNTTASFERLVDTIARKNIVTHQAFAGEVIADESGYALDILAPTQGFFSEELNDYSAVVLLTYKDVSYLFTGDAPYEELAAVSPGHVDVLKVSHHGSKTGTSRSLLRLITPRYAVISYGIGNDYGHPKSSVLDMLQDSGAEIFGTGAQGTISIVTDGNTISPSTEKEGKIQAG